LQSVSILDPLQSNPKKDSMKYFFFSELSWCLRQNALQLTTLESLPEQELRWWPTMSNHGWNIFLCIYLSATHSSFVYVNIHPVCVPSSLGFPFSCWLPLAYMHLTACLTLCPKAYIPSHSCHPKPYTKNAVLMSVLLYSKQNMIIHDAPKRLPEHAASLQQQRTAGNSGLPGLSGCHMSSLIWDSFFLPLGPCLPWTLSHFVFQRLQAFV
jgi:hypothetical protein